jgi:hypothetical protein
MAVYKIQRCLIDFPCHGFRPNLDTLDWEGINHSLEDSFQAQSKILFNLAFFLAKEYFGYREMPTLHHIRGIQYHAVGVAASFRDQIFIVRCMEHLCIGTHLRMISFMRLRSR